MASSDSVSSREAAIRVVTRRIKGRLYGVYMLPVIVVTCIGLLKSSEIFLATGGILFLCNLGIVVRSAVILDYRSAYSLPRYPIRRFFYGSKRTIMLFSGINAATALIIGIPATIIFATPHSIANKTTYFAFVIVALVVDYRAFRRGLITASPTGFRIHQQWRNRFVRMQDVPRVEISKSSGFIHREQVSILLRNGERVPIPGFATALRTEDGTIEGRTFHLASDYLERMLTQSQLSN